MDIAPWCGTEKLSQNADSLAPSRNLQVARQTSCAQHPARDAPGVCAHPRTPASPGGVHIVHTLGCGSLLPTYLPHTAGQPADPELVPRVLSSQPPPGRWFAITTTAPKGDCTKATAG